MQSFGIEKWALIYGFSMGAMIALQWAVQFPTKMASVVAVAGSARCNPVDVYHLKKGLACFTSDPHCEFDGAGIVTGFREKPTEGIRNINLVTLDWLFDAPSATSLASPNASRPEYARSKPGGRFYAEGLYKELNGKDNEPDFREAWVQNDLANGWDALDLYRVLHTWMNGDPAADPKYGGDLARALGDVQALVYLMPGSTDQYFVAEDIEKESMLIPRCIFQPLVSPFGHIVEFRPECQAQIQAGISACLSSGVAKLPTDLCPATTVLVTGAADDLGKQVVARLLERPGLHVIAVDKRTPKEPLTAPNVHYVEVDLAEPMNAPLIDYLVSRCEKVVDLALGIDFQSCLGQSSKTKKPKTQKQDEA